MVRWFMAMGRRSHRLNVAYTVDGQVQGCQSVGKSHENADHDRLISRSSKLYHVSGG